MKKFYTLVLALACCATVNAESLKILSLGLGTPGLDEPQMQGLSISPNGRYVCGGIEGGIGVFITDLQTDNTIYTMAGDEGGELRHIDNNGLAVGIFDGGVTYDYATETVDEVDAPAGFKYVIPEAITNDGSMIVGSLVGSGFITMAAYKKGNDEWKSLPVPPAEELAGFRIGSESAAKLVSGDGKVIVGFLGSFTAPIVWIMNEQGEFEYDFFVPRVIKSSPEDDTKILTSVSGNYWSLSNNGKYVALWGLFLTPEVGTDAGITVPVIYNTETRDVTVYNELQNIDGTYRGLYTTAIADDGTFVGTIGQPYFGACASFIWKGGAAEAEAFIDAFPEFDKELGESDLLGFGIPTGISADGSKIVGYSYTTDDFMDASTPAYYVTYVIDRDGGAGVDLIATDGNAATPKEVYNLSGQRVSGTPAGGVYLVRMSDGSVQKVIK